MSQGDHRGDEIKEALDVSVSTIVSGGEPAEVPHSVAIDGGFIVRMMISRCGLTGSRLASRIGSFVSRKALLSQALSVRTASPLGHSRKAVLAGRRRPDRRSNQLSPNASASIWILVVSPSR